MPRNASKGNCELCGKSYRKSGMTRHLQSCLAKAGGGAGGAGRSIHLLVEDTFRPEYWLHLAVPAAASLLELDACLRHIWLECCFHLSAFTIDRAYYAYTPFREDENDSTDIFGILSDIERNNMNVALGDVAPPGKLFHHEYDFGSTTDLALRSLGEIDGDGGGQIRLLARNDAPAAVCVFCGAPASWAARTGDDWIAMTGGLCERCAPRVDLDDRLPILNSPRCGVCGYDGDTIIIGEPIGGFDDDDNDNDGE